MAKIKYETLTMQESTEIEFITAVVNYITSIDSRVICMSNIEEELETFAEAYDSTRTYAVGDYCIYDDGSSVKTMICSTAITTPEEYDSSKWTASTKKATFDFNIDNKFVLRLEREQQNNTSGSDGYIPILCDTNRNAIMNICDYPIAYMSTGSDTIASFERDDRTWKIFTIVDPDLIGIWIINFNDTLFSTSNMNDCAVMEFVDLNDSYWLAINNVSRIFDNSEDTAIIKKCSNFAVTGELARMFNYNAESGYIDYLSHVIIKDSDGYKMADTRTLFSSTNVTPGVSYGLADGSYMAIDTNVLVKVDEE